MGMLDQRTHCHEVTLGCIRPSKAGRAIGPVHNAVIEAFSARFVQERLTEHWLLFVTDAQDRRAGVAVALQPGPAAQLARQHRA